MPEAERPTPKLRLARLAEADAIDALMKASTRDLFPGWYDAEQTAAAIVYVASVDRTLIACGGWSRRDKRYAGAGEGAGDARLLDPATEPARVRAMFVRSDWTRRGLGRRILEACEAAARAEGFRRLLLGATLPGRPFYEAYGFSATGDERVIMPNGVEMAAVMMEMPLG